MPQLTSNNGPSLMAIQSHPARAYTLLIDGWILRARPVANMERAIPLIRRSYFSGRDGKIELHSSVGVGLLYLYFHWVMICLY